MNLRQKYKAAKKQIMQLEKRLDLKRPFQAHSEIRHPLRYRVTKTVDRRLVENPEYMAQMARFMADDIADRFVSDGLINPRIYEDYPIDGMMLVTAEIEVLP